MKELKCNFVVDFIDEFDFSIDLPLEIKSHIEKCESCRKYLKMTEFLKDNFKKIEKVDVKNEVLLLINSKKFKFERVFIIGGVIITLFIGLILIFNPLRKNDTAENFYTSSISSTSETIDSLEYFYTIALEI